MIEYISGEITINDDASVIKVMYEKKIVSNLVACNFENGKYLASIMDIPQLRVMKL